MCAYINERVWWVWVRWMCDRYGTIKIAIQQHLLTGILLFENNTFWVSESSTQTTAESIVTAITHTHTSIHAADLRPCHLSEDAILPSKNVYHHSESSLCYFVNVCVCARIVSRIRWECVLFFHFSTNIIILCNKGDFFFFWNWQRNGKGWTIFFLGLIPSIFAYWGWMSENKI